MLEKKLIKKSASTIAIPFMLVSAAISPELFAQATITSCADIENSEERLVCYDRAAESASQMPVVRLPRPATSRTIENSTQESSSSVNRQSEFGFEGKRNRPNTANSQTLSVAEAKHNDFTGWTITFSDGSVWKQVGTEDYDVKVGENYTITRRSLNSFLLSNYSNNKKIRVRRVE